MARFRLHLIGTPHPLDVDLPVSGVAELVGVVSHARFITGNMADPDHHGVCPGVLIPTCRLQMVVEAD